MIHLEKFVPILWACKVRVYVPLFYLINRQLFQYNLLKRHPFLQWIRVGTIDDSSFAHPLMTYLFYYTSQRFYAYAKLGCFIYTSFRMSLENFLVEFLHLCYSSSRLSWLGNGQTKYDTSIPQYQQEEGINFETTCIFYDGSITRSLCWEEN